MRPTTEGSIGPPAHAASRALVALVLSVFASACVIRPAPAPSAPNFTGRIYDVARDTFISEQELAERLVGAAFVLLGEQHDNPHHHLLEARVISLLLANGLRPIVAFEMLSTDRVSAIADCQTEPRCSVEEFRHAVEWDVSGWPPWDLYRPLFQVVFDAQLPIVAGDMSAATMSLIVGSSADYAAERAAWLDYLGLERAMNPKERAELVEEIQQAHCNLAPAEALPGMVRGQRARDSHLALTVERARATSDGPVVLVAGRGHIRTDRGVPTYFTATARQEPTLSLAFLEMDTKHSSTREYTAEFRDDLPFDIVWFTEPVEREDLCEFYRERLQSIGKKPPA